MPEEVKTLNEPAAEDAAFNQGGLGEPSTSDDPQIDPNAENLFNTAGDVLDSSPDGGAKPEDSAEPGTKEEPDKDLSGQEDRFDKHPRFKELVQQREELKEQVAKMSGQLEVLTKQGESRQPEQPKQVPKDYKDVTEYLDKPEELTDWFNEDPVGFMANFAKQVRTETANDLQTRQSQESLKKGVESEFGQFSTAFPDFTPLINEGKIQSYMKDHPGHNAMSAYFMLTNDRRLSEVKTEAQKAAEEKVLSNMRAKRQTTIIGNQSAPKDSANQDVDLINTKQHGGLNAVLANRLVSLRKRFAGAA